MIKLKIGGGAPFYQLHTFYQIVSNANKDVLPICEFQQKWSYLNIKEMDHNGEQMTLL